MARALLSLAGILLLAPAARADLPRFTEEREAAALFFVRKHVPELVPLLDQLRKASATAYRQQVGEIFQVTEMLADLQDDPRRHDLELKMWKVLARANVLVAHLSTPSAEERKRFEMQLLELVRELADLDVLVLELRAEQLDKELDEVKEQLSKARENPEQQAEQRYEQLLEKAKKLKK